MKIQILGTAAAECWPAIFCGCDTCMKARAAGGKNIRSRASILINGTIKVDMGPDTYHHVAAHGLDLSKLEHVIFTHSHSDHMSPAEFGYLRSPFAHNRAKERVDIWGNATVVDELRKHFGDGAHLSAELHQVVPFKTIALGGLKATPIIAVHKKDETCLNWLFGDLDDAVLYTCDTGFYGEATWEYLSTVKLGLVITECTCGFLFEDAGGHMSVPSVRRLLSTLGQMGSLKDGYRVVLTHFSHNMGLLHDEFQERVREDGFVVAYDGMVLEGGS